MGLIRMIMACKTRWLGQGSVEMNLKVICSRRWPKCHSESIEPNNKIPLVKTHLTSTTPIEQAERLVKFLAHQIPHFMGEETQSG